MSNNSTKPALFWTTGKLVAAFAGTAVLLAVLASLGFGGSWLGASQGAPSTLAVPSKHGLDADLPSVIPTGTKLVIGDPTTQQVLKHTGWDKHLPFEIVWANISGGPAVTEAFQAKALDIGSAANIPPIHAIWVGIPVKIIAWRHKLEPLTFPTYVIGLSPKAEVKTLADLKGKKIAFSPGQAQGVVVLRTLAGIGLSPKDVTLVELPSTADVYTGALVSNLVDAAPLGTAGLGTKRYIDSYGAQGARILSHGEFRDDAGILYVRNETLEDPGKAAALREYVKLWGRAAEWVEQNRKEWARIYYVEKQGVSLQDAEYVLERSGSTQVPADWTDIIPLQQETIDFLSKHIGRESFKAETIFDRRFERLGAEGVERYRRDAAAATAAPAATAARAATGAPAGTRAATATDAAADPAR
ncbi:hypothetical protein LBMAG53_23620 [Planctomycetota bacterium]|nr:hypothetical protein LBMAG53_23620 [Planctomycetota bacterium]